MNKVTESTRKIIGRRINELLAINDVKQKELAAYLSISDNIVSYFVKGTRVPNTEQIIKIANFFNVPTDYLLDTDWNKKTNSNFKGRDGIFAKRLRELIKTKGIKHGDIADKKVLNVSRQAVGQYCNGTALPPADKIVILARYFDVSADYLLGLTDAKTTKDTDLRAIVDYTGLNEECIKEISPGISENPYANECAYILNQMFSTKEGQTITHRIFDMLSHKG